MIFDMTRRSSGGGGSGPSASDAILTVTVPTGSTATMTKGGVTLAPTMWVQAANNTLDCALFVIAPSLFDAQNAWTVTATRGTDTASDTVTISTNKQYDMVLSYHVPPGYQEVEYIKNTGSAWIDFNVSPAINFRMVFRACSDVADNGALAGIYTSGGNVNAWRVNLQYNSGKYGYFANSGSGSAIFLSESMSYGTLVDMEYIQSQGSQKLTVDGVSVTSSNTGVSAKNACTFFRYQGSSAYYGKGKLQHAEIYNDGLLVRDMWSCYRKSDSVAGMWDKVTETLFTNAGSGTFVVGPDV